MKHHALPLLVALSAVFGFARTASDKDTVRAVQGARQLRNSVLHPDSLQVTRAVITGGNVCIDYRGSNESGATSTGVAVYEADKNLVFVDNSWVWQRDCLFGKYGQRREGEDATEAVGDALKRQTAPPLNAKEEPVVRPVQPAVSASSSAPSTHAAVPPTGIVTTLTAQPIATAPAELPLPVAKAPAATAVEARIVTSPVDRPPVPTQRVEPVALTLSSVTPAIASAPVATATALPQPAAAALVETQAAGAVIIGANGTVPGTSSPAAPESLGDAARRLKREKLQRQQRQPRQVP